MLLLDILKKRIPKEVFGEGELHLALKDMSLAARYSALSRLLKSKSVLKIKRGLYVFAEKHRKQPLSKYVIASRLYSPSYISFESALSYHGLIPETVPVTISACSQMKKKVYITPLGDFAYHYIPELSFRLGVESVHSKSGTFLMADPIKALFDTVYVKKSDYKNLDEIEADLRIEGSDLKTIVARHSYLDLETLALSYKKKNCNQLFHILMRELK